ncbi:MAG: DUF2924 domain-containing protein [Alphaproteobacteria bacterium]|nr:DUF2924 domain-containing protein [Alphaproteobacteria bacterium]
MALTRRDTNPASIRREITGFQNLDLDALRATWRSKFKRDGAGLSRDVLLRMLIWRIQEQAFGGYDRSTEIALKRYAGSNGNLGGDGIGRHVRTGSVLVREYQGARHTVTVVPNGFAWRERTYPNLSKIAFEITGVKWNGPRFFGLRQAKNIGAADKGGFA